ncbi:uncharacterized protein LOC120335312 [Styela clava]
MAKNIQYSEVASTHSSSSAKTRLSSTSSKCLQAELMLLEAQEELLREKIETAMTEAKKKKAELLLKASSSGTSSRHGDSVDLTRLHFSSDETVHQLPIRQYASNVGLEHMVREPSKSNVVWESSPITSEGVLQSCGSVPPVLTHATGAHQPVVNSYAREGVLQSCGSVPPVLTHATGAHQPVVNSYAREGVLQSCGSVPPVLTHATGAHQPVVNSYGSGGVVQSGFAPSVSTLATGAHQPVVNSYESGNRQVGDGIYQAVPNSALPLQTATSAVPPDYGAMINALREGFTLPKVELMEFDGNPLRFHAFMKSFETNIHCHQHAPETKLAQLIQLCSGIAKDAIKNLVLVSPPSKGYQMAWQTLHEQFGNRTVVIEATSKEVTNGPKIMDDDTQGLCKLATQLRNCEIVLSEWNANSFMDGYENLERVFSRLPMYLQRKYADQFDDSKLPTFSHLVAFVVKKAQLTTTFYGRIVTKNSAKQKSTIRVTKPRMTRTTSYAVTNTQEKTPGPKVADLQYKCVDCQGNHALHNCVEFKGRSVNDRAEMVRRNNLCFNCLYRSHRENNCPSKYVCQVNGCGKLHHSLLHVDQKKPPTTGAHFSSNANSQNNVSAPKKENGAGAYFANVNCSENIQNFVRLKVVPVEVTSNGASDAVCTYAFLDEGSTRSLCSHNLLAKLGIEGKPEDCMLATANGSKLHSGKTVSLKVKGCDSERVVDIPNVLAINLPNLESSIPTANVLQKYPHLGDLEFPVLGSSEVDLLIGAEVLANHPISEIRLCDQKAKFPAAHRTVFGWALFGPDRTMSHSSCESVSAVSCPRLNTVCACDTDQFLCKICGHDFIDLDCDPFTTEHSLDDKKALVVMNDTAVKVNGRYQVALPWKDKNIKLPNNRQMAVKRLESQKRKFIRDPDLFFKYKSKINDYLDKGYAEIVPESDPGSLGRTWYMPHHSTGAKFRVVFDCSAECGGTSLNKNLLSGPDLNTNLVSILLRFREEAVAFICDVREMYLRVILDSRDRDAMRFLWYPNDDLGKKPIDLRMCSHVFGATSSPSIASFVLKRVADDNLTNADLETIQTVQRSFFVDDGVKSKRTVDETLQLINQLIELLASGGFCLTKFACNKIEVMEAIPEADRSTATKALDFSTELTERTLGIYWNMVHDVFKVRVEIEFRPSTRRGMLSMLGQVYDPLGFIQPFLIPARRILQDLCFLGYSWDDPVEGDLYDGWEKWISTLPSLRELTIQRCYKPEGFEAANVQLHCFCDASRVGYGAVAYLRLENESGEVHCAFVKGTARVTPKKLVTIPRLELTAAVVATEVAHSVTNALDYEIHETCFWTDSMTVLQMLNSRSQRFKTFVANRVNIIQSISDVSQWSHVPTNENPADIASRGLMPDKLDKAKLWFQGPSFLWQQSVSWPGTSSVSDTIPTNSDLHCEIKVNLVEVQKRSQYFPELINRYSTWEKLSRTIAWMLRFKFFILWKTCRSNDSPMTGDLTVTELSVATIQICKLAQIESFSPELEYFSERVHDGPNYLSSGCKLPTSPHSKALIKLSPFLDNDILRVGGRLRHSHLSPEQKHPIILPPHHHVTKLIIEYYHRQNGHSGTLHTLSSVREKFWILCGQAEVRKVLNACKLCKLRASRPGSQWMAPLPESRVLGGRTPFYHTAVDYFGPLKVKLGRKEYKRYGCIFTCSVTRAVHIEVSESLDASAFLQAFFRFCDRRSKPSHVISDNGTNFVAGERLLAEGICK